MIRSTGYRPPHFSATGMDDGGGASADRSGLPARQVSFCRYAADGDLFFLVLLVAGRCGRRRGFMRARFTLPATRLPRCRQSASLRSRRCPLYSILFHTFGVMGLAWASDIGISVNLLALAWLLHYKKLVPLGGLRWRRVGEIGGDRRGRGSDQFEVARVVPLGDHRRWRPNGGLAPTGVGHDHMGWRRWRPDCGCCVRSCPAICDGERDAYPAVAQGQSKEILGAGQGALIANADFPTPLQGDLRHQFPLWNKI